MKIDLPQWKEGYTEKVTEEAYNKLLAEIKPLLDRCLQIYEAYLRTGNDLLYDTFSEVCPKMYPMFHILGIAGNWRELWDKSKQLATAAEIVSGADELPYKATMLWDLAGCIRG